MNAPLDAWSVLADDFPADGTSEEKLWFLVRYAILAPSTHNTQPWRFRMHGNVVELYGDFARALPVVDPENRELIMSCGAALLHLRAAIRYFGYGCTVEPLPDPEDPALLARVHLGFKCDTNAEDILLFNAIQKRRTNRQAFLPDPVPDALLATLTRIAAEEGAWLQVVEGVWASFLNQPIEVPELRPQLASIIGRVGFPQLLLRLGFGPEVKPTPRRSAQEVIIKPHQHTIAHIQT